MNIEDRNEYKEFKVKYTFFDETRETELSMFIDEKNILAFERYGQKLTTRWNLDDLALWLRNFINNMSEDPFPVAVEGEYAAIKDILAREFDTDDDQLFDEYYDKLDEWNLRHRWHTTCNGAILADLYFQLVEDDVEISWNNQDAEDGVDFDFEIGGVSIPKEIFLNEINSFLRAYANHWYK
jgi:hypothetical protein